LLNQFYPLTKTNDTNKTKAAFNHVKVKAFVIVERRYNKKRMAINEFFSKEFIWQICKAELICEKGTTKQDRVIIKPIVHPKKKVLSSFTFKNYMILFCGKQKETFLRICC